MSPFKSTRIAWSVAVAALALWASSAPVSWGQAAAGATRLLAQQTADDTTTNNTTTTTRLDLTQQEDVNANGGANTSTEGTSADSGAAPCVPLPAALAQVVPTLTLPAAPAAAAPPAVSGTDSGTFRVCGADPQTAQAIEQLLGGRGFSATLSARGDGCADLTIRATSPVSSGSSSSNLSVSLGSGHTLSIRITSHAGATSVSIG